MKGMLFKPDMIKASAEGRKTQTRRLQGLDEINKAPDGWMWAFVEGSREFQFSKNGYFWVVRPRYQVGETVYIKETYAFVTDPFQTAPRVFFRDGTTKKLETLPDGTTVYNYIEHPEVIKWHSPMMMPEWASRYHLQILDIKPQRLQEITPEDCIAEGTSPDKYGNLSVMHYAQLWNSINKEYQWNSNPWVWVYTFKLLDSR